MPATMPRPRTRAVARPVLVTLLALLLAASVGLSRSRADDPPEPVAITAGAGLDWGLKASFRSYVVGPIAHGAIELSGGATRNEDGTFHFPVAGGEYDPESSATVVRFGGTVRFSGHDDQLQMVVAAPRVEITPEGARLVADVRSRSLDDGAPLVDYPSVVLASLDVEDATPLVADGTTTWSALPATLTDAGAPAFAGFYAPGTALDPLTLAYDGPGGTPQRETWATPGAAAYGVTGEGTVPGGVGTLALGAPGTLWAGSYDDESVTRVRTDTLAATATVDVGHESRAVAANPLTGRAFSTGGVVRSITDGDPPTLDADEVWAGNGYVNALAVRPTDGAVLHVNGSTLTVVAPNGAGWSTSTFDLGAAYAEAHATTDGRVFVSGGAPPGPAVAEVTFDGNAATVAPIPETMPRAGGSAGAVAIADDGAIAFSDTVVTYPPLAYDRRTRIVRPDGAGGWDAEVTGAQLGTIAAALSPDGDTLVAAHTDNSGVRVVRDGVVVATIPGSGVLNDIVVDAQGTAYASWRTGRVARIARIGTVPEITSQPASVAVVVPTADATGSARLSVEATGTPAPTFRWQQRAAGRARWTDVPGATSADLTVDATPAGSGTAYRAVVTNAAGSIVTSIATVTVTVAPPSGPGGETPGDADPGGQQPGGERPGGGTPATTTPVPAVPPTTSVDTAPKGPTAVPRIVRATGIRRLSTRRTATIARLRCPAGGPCAVTAPRRVGVVIAGRRHVTTVATGSRVAAGRTATVRVRFGRAAARRLRGRSATVRVRVRVRNARGARTSALRVRVQGRR
jgi:hypothetical protein